MKTIFKYELKLLGCTNSTVPVQIPEGATFLNVGEQSGDIFLWAEVDTNSEEVEYNFEVFGTGHEIYEGMGTSRTHIGSLIMAGGSLVFHVYRRVD